ncbi:MAG TPA: hypothetical protein DDY13_11140 [Cytophagales bacterium]|jgi:hypothetical protein|nr:hypothetical protein [Cytophagales bacterium]
MKKLIGIWCLMFFAGITMAEELTKEDTVEILFGDNSKIIILVNDKEDLKKLDDYDMNQVLEDLKETLDEQQTEEKNVVIEYNDGVDTVIVEELEEDEFEALEREFESENWDSKWDNDNSDNDYDDDWSDNRSWEKYEGKKRWYSDNRTQYMSFLHIGFNNFMSDGSIVSGEQYDVKGWGSWYVAFEPSFQYHIAGPLALDYGGGFAWYNFKYQDPSTIMIKGEDEVLFLQATDDRNYQKSKLTVAYLNAHLVPMFDFGYRTTSETYNDGQGSIKKIRYDRQRFRIGAGMYAGYKLDSYSKVTYRSDGGKSKDREKSSYFIRNFRYGVKGIVGIGDVDFWITYDLSPIFSENRGPELNPVTFGVSF